MTKPKRPKTEAEKQRYYRDARTKGYYGDIWTSTGKCVFCDLREKYIVFEEDGVILTTSLYAYIDGDMMIIPRRHVQTASELTNQEWEAVRKLMHVARKTIKKVYDIKAINFIQRHGGVAAQSTVGHYHIKVIPFDSPDLVTWHYRELAYTPLENARRTKAQRRFITEQSVRFDKKYGQTDRLPIYAQLRARRNNQLLVTRSGDLPGGYIVNNDTSLVEQLKAYVTDQVGLKLSKKNELSVQTTALVKRSQLRKEPHLKVTYPKNETLLSITYELELDDKANVTGRFVDEQTIS